MGTESSGEVPPLKKALAAIQKLKARVRSLEGGPIAIVGAGLRLPGGVRSLDGYWQLLSSGIDAVREVPADRWDVDRWSDPDPAAPGKMITRSGGFLDDVATFDPAFFGISPREALEMDPAQRLLLEVAWEALEHAAIAPDALERSATGVYVGLGLSDYARRHFLSPDPAQLTAYSGTGSFLSVAAGRIAYTLGLTGPAMTVDTACSSSLVSIHLAVDALRRGECDAALAGGANLILTPEPSVYFSKLSALAPDGRCKTFSASADGYGRGEGAGMVVLKRLDDALEAGDPILAVIRGTAVNQDGRSNGLTAPSGRAQAAVIRAALSNAGLRPEEISLIEAHGTGTPLGDPIEVDALKAIFGRVRSATEPLFLGSAKTNLGHLETAAGVAGLLKLVLCIQHGQIPPHLHLDALNPRIKLEGTALTIPTALVPWTDEARLGGVSSFGLSGTNAHVVVGPPPQQELQGASRHPVELIPLSARSPEQLAQLAGRWAEVVADQPLPDVAHTAWVGRARLPHRLAVAARSSREAAERLSAFAQGDLPTGTQVGVHAGASDEGVVFLFTGQGSQQVGMGKQLYDADPVFRAALDRALAALDPHLEGPLADVMWGDGDALHDTRWTQPALFALELALAELWRHRGIEPDAVIGHSIGELSAAAVAGVMSLPDAALLVAERGRRMAELPRQGAMLAIFAPEADVREALAPHLADADISGINSPTEVVISGRTEAIEAVASHFEARDVQVRRLRVSHAFHSVLMEPMLEGFEAVARGITLHPPELPLISNLDGQPAGARITEAGYWPRQVRSAVRFADGLQTLLQQGHRLFLELGPRPVLSGMGRRICGDQPATFVPSLHPDRPDTEQITEALGALWASGAQLEPPHPTGRRLRLPTTPFLGERLWLEPVVAPAPAPAAPVDPQVQSVLEVAWRRAEAPSNATSGDWVVLGDDALAKALAARGATVHREWVEEPAGVVVAPAGRDLVDLAWRAAESAKRLATLPGSGRLWLVGHTHERPQSAVMHGVGRVVAVEHPDRWGGFIDVVQADAGAIADAILADDGEDHVQLSEDGRRVARLVHADRAFTDTPLPIGSGPIWITGGFGALGRQVARWFADQGAEHLILSGRSGAGSDEARALVEDLQQRGLTIEAVAADVSKKKDVARVIEASPGLSGIVHCAGINDDGRLADLTWPRFEKVMKGKALGAQHLHNATAELPLDFFVLFSSAAGVLGTPGQANYAAANAYLDALARWRRAQGLPATSLAFGPWQGAGMAEALGDTVLERWAREGVHLLEPSDGLAILGRTGAGAAPAVLVAPFRWAPFQEQRPGPMRLVDELVAAQAAQAPQPPPAPQPAAPQPVPQPAAQPTLRAELASAPEGARPKMVADHVQQVASHVLRRGPDQRLGATEGFFDAGMDSLMAMELRDRLRASLGVALSATAAFDYPTVERLSEHLLPLLELQPDEASAAAGAEATGATGAPTAHPHRDEPIAIVGAACRLPGGIEDLEALWALIDAAGSAITEVPPERWDAQRYQDPGGGTPGRITSACGGFVEGIEDFEPQHFRITPREAASLDPQQRLLLEVAWHALEHAAIAPDTLRDTPTGVYVGIGPSEYWLRFDPASPEVDAYAATGNEASFAAGRIAHSLGLTGPALAVDTACSSSLVSVHLAVSALRAGACSVALAGGANAIVGPEHSLWLSRLGALSPSGTCRAFDAAADGYVRSEGAAMIVLKRYSDAERDGDPILAVIRGSAVGHDGVSAGLTVPSARAQQAVIRAALADAGVEPHEVGLVECHGTGTKLGDPIEIAALSHALADAREAPLFLSAIKPNLGHLEAAAGVVGLLRAVLALQHDRIPPLAQLQTPSPELDPAPALRLPTQGEPWPGDLPRIAGVSSFGLSGTNAHVVLSAAPARADESSGAQPTAPAAGAEAAPVLITISGRTEAGLQAQAEALVSHLDRAEVALEDLAHTQNTGRAGLDQRSALIAADLQQLRDGLASPPIHDRALQAPSVVFLCTGAGPQQVGMGRQLYDAEPAFRAALDDAAAAAAELLDPPLLEVMFGDAADAERHLGELTYTQPAMFALQWATAQLWHSQGVQPDAVIGHSTGQLIAACLAGVMELATGMRLCVARGRLMAQSPGDGAMVAVLASEQEVRRYLQDVDEVDVAALNGPQETVLSGRASRIDAIVAALEADGVELRRLKISHAAHSALMDPVLDAYEALFADVELHAARLPLYDNVTGALAGAELQDPGHWRRHLREPVRFHDAILGALAAGHRTFLELGNHPVLCGAAARCAEHEPDARFVPSLRRQQPEPLAWLEAAGRLWARGVGVDLAAVGRHRPGRRIVLPPTQFQRSRHWVERPEPGTTAPATGSSWTYGIRWRPVRPDLQAVGGRGPAPLMIFADAGGLGQQLAERSERPVVQVRPGAELAIDGDTATVDPSDPAQLDQLLAQLAPAEIVYLWGLDAPEPGASPSEASTPAVRAALHLLAAASRHGEPAVWLITRGAASVRGEAPDLAQAPLLGLGNGAAVELSLPLVRLDLDPADPAHAVAHLQLALSAGLREDQLAIRNGQLLARRLVRISAAAAPPQLRTDASYLVTGGPGALGLQLAGWLVAHGARSVVLCSRGEPDDEAGAAIAALSERDGVQITHQRADVGDPQGVQRLLQAIEADGLPPIGGVFHAAGIVEDAPLLTARFEQLQAMWRAKLDGAHHLDQALPDVDLFVLFSSAASQLGTPGQAGYGSANAYLDALASARRARGQHGLALGWGPWAGAGLASGHLHRFGASGVHPLPPQPALEVMGRLLDGPHDQVAVVDLDWSDWPRSLPRVPALVRELATDLPAQGSLPLLQALRVTPADRHAGLLVDAVAERVAAVAGLQPGSLDRGRGLTELGLDSLMMVELAHRLRADLDPSLPITIAFDHPSVEALAEHLLEAHVATALATAPIGRHAPAAARERRIDLDEPIAIVGLACRMPGGANDPEAFWRILADGVDPIAPIPDSRWDVDAYYDATPGTPGKMNTRCAGLVDQAHVEGFDPEFFGTSPREAASLDPQQRMLLEVGVEALQRAGVPLDGLRHSATGVFVGVGDSGYLQRFQGSGAPLYADLHAGTGNLSAFASGRLAHALGLRGPNLSLNTACSSSLVAVHLAAGALRAGDCTLALAGGVHLMLSPEHFVYVSQLGALSPDGRCKAFDASADGYGRSEGCALFVLKRLSDAERDGDRVLAVIRGSAVGHDGASAGLTVPSGPAQAEVLAGALSRSGLDPLDVSYLEAHGTGTKLGDPIEVRAITEVYARDRADSNPLHLGAVKSNVGHLEIAAGAASLLKVVLALQHRQIPPHLHLQAPNPELGLADVPVVIDTQLIPWEAPSGVLRAGVSGFGLAGTNAHLIVEQAPPAPEPAVEAPPIAVLPLSARSPGALSALAAQHQRQLADGAALAPIAAAAALARSAHPHRLAITAGDAAQAAALLQALAEDPDSSGISQGHVTGRLPRVAFLYSGQGSQHPGMGRELYEAVPAYRDALDRCAAILDPLMDRPLLEVLHSGDDPAIHDTTWTQPCLFAHEVALTELWRALGIEPVAVAGHSVGQLVAAWSAGVFSLEDGLELIVERGRLMGGLPHDGAMIAVFADEDQVAPHLEPHGDHLGLAAINGPGEVVVSGRAEHIMAVTGALRSAGLDVRELTVSHAFHSPLMDPILDAFEAVAASIELRPAALPVMCNLSGGVASDADLQRPGYWRELIRSPVRFADDLRALDTHDVDVFLEIGPHTALLGMARRTLSSAGPDRAWLPSLRRGEPQLRTLCQSLGELWTRGAQVDWSGLYPPGLARPQDLPTYPWQRRRCWIDRPEWPQERPAPAFPEPLALRWRPAQPGPDTPRASGRWLVIGEGPVARAVVQAASARGAQASLSEDLPHDLDGIEQVVWVARPQGAQPTDHPEAAAVALLEGIGALVAAGRPIRLALITQGATSAGGPPTDPLQHALWGLLRVARLEHPGLGALALDLEPGDPGPLESGLDALIRGLPEAALRQGALLVPRLTPAPGRAPRPLRRDGTYLITGGLRGLGLQIARWLSEHGAGSLVLISRSAPDAAAEAVIAQLRDAGTEVTVAQADVADRPQIARIVSGIDADRPLRGVIHAAGVLADGALLRLDAESFRTVWRPKVLGTWSLQEATAELPLDFFVLFSAGAALLGAAGQGNYAAANAYLDAFAGWARGQGRPVTSVGWGAWAQVGMAARMGPQHRARQAADGIGRLSLDQGLEALGQLLGADQPHLGILPVDWERLVATAHGGRRPDLLAELVDAPLEAPDVPRSAGPALRAAIEGQPRSGWPPIVAEHLHSAACRVLGLDPTQRLDPGQPLLEVGLDSLLAVELKNALADAGVDVPVARVMTGPSLDQLTVLVLSVLDETTPAAGAVGEPELPPAVVAPPIHPIASHLLAFVLGIVAAIGLYALTLVVAGPSSDLEQPPASSALEAPGGG